jgi:urease accessory protein
MPPTPAATDEYRSDEYRSAGPALGATLLLLADSRLPAGGHAHSGGAEQAIAAGAVHDLDSLLSFLRGRLATTGLVAAALAATACVQVTLGPVVDEQVWRELDFEADARTASPAQRGAARTQGRLLLRVARRIWPSPLLDDLARALPSPHHPVALGAVAGVSGCTPRDAALATAYHSITGPATAAVRLLGLDPVEVHRILAVLSRSVDDTARTASATRHPHDLPASAAPALDLLAEQHLQTDLRLFVS